LSKLLFLQLLVFQILEIMLVPLILSLQTPEVCCLQHTSTHWLAAVVIGVLDTAVQALHQFQVFVMTSDWRPSSSARSVRCYTWL
jgi:hypothetical protein